MPHMTHAYPFEWKIFVYSKNLSFSLTGDNKPFLMVLGDDGAVQRLLFEHSESDWRRLIDDLEAVGQPFLFYDPFEVPEYTWLSWHLIERPTMERMVGDPFEDDDFRKGEFPTPRAPELEPADTFPVSWSVMF